MGLHLIPWLKTPVKVDYAFSQVGWVTCDPRGAMMKIQPRGFKNPPYKLNLNDRRSITQLMTNAHSIQSVLTHAATLLNAKHNDAKTAKLEAQLLLQNVLNVNRAWLIAHENDAIEAISGQANIFASYQALINRRVNGEPIAYILGSREFYGLKLKVSPDTLIPRPDTETLVDAALVKIGLLLSPSPLAPLPPTGEGNKAAILSPSPAGGRGVGERGIITILDLGTGSGAIALAIAKHRPQAFVLALDVSQAALDVAIVNAKNLKIPNVEFVLSDWFSALNQQNNMQKFDVIVSNPPYIEQNDEHLSQGDLRFEPISALASGADGLDAICIIISQAKNHLNPHGWLLLEHGYHQAANVANLLKKAGFSHIETIKDLGGNDRVTLGKISKLSFWAKAKNPVVPKKILKTEFFAFA